MGMKVAIALCKEHVCHRLDCADQLVMLDVEDGQERNREAIDLTGWSVHGRAVRFGRMGVAMLVCGAVSRFDEAGFDDVDVRLVSGVRGPLEEVLRAIRSGTLASDRDYWPRAPARGK
jgi:predicted Fe-Mo cluster-binding NifX family protein